MQIRNVRLIVLALSVVVFFMACSRHTVPIIDYDNIAITTKSGKALSLDDIKKALIIAAVETKRNWQTTDVSPGHSKATLVVRGKHTVVIDIMYSESKIAIKYSDSTNMKYNAESREIHPGYNTWVGEYVKAIERTLLSM